MANSKPLETISLPVTSGVYVHAAIWANETSNGTMFSVTLDKRYRDGDQWKSTKSFSGSELLAVAHASQRAYDRVTEIRAQQQTDAA